MTYKIVIAAMLGILSIIVGAIVLRIGAKGHDKGSEFIGGFLIVLGVILAAGYIVMRIVNTAVQIGS